MFNTKKIIILCTIIILSAICISSTAVAKDKPTIGISTSDYKNEFWVNWVQGVRDACKELGLELIESDAAGSEIGQLRGVEDMIVKGIDILVVSPVTMSAAQPIVELCEENKVYMTMFIGMRPEDLAPKDYKYYTAWVCNYAEPLGYKPAKYLAEYLGGKGNVVAIQGMAGGLHGEARKTGSNKAFAEFPGIKLLGQEYGQWHRGEALKVMEDFLVRFPNIDGVYVANDDMALGALSAIKASGRKIPVTGGDALTDALRAVMDDEILITFTHGQYELGGLSLIFAYDQFYGYPAPKGNEPTPREGVILGTYLKKEDFPGWKSGKVGSFMIYKKDITEDFIANKAKPTISWPEQSRQWCKTNNIEWKGTWAP